jgi:hypothetical protein
MDGCDGCSINLASWYHTNEYVSYWGGGILKRFFGPLEENDGDPKLPVSLETFTIN